MNSPDVVATGACGLAAVTVLRGNHEQMLLKAMARRAPDEDVELWLCNGGTPDLLPLARERQATDDLIWIRRLF